MKFLKEIVRQTTKISSIPLKECLRRPAQWRKSCSLTYIKRLETHHATFMNLVIQEIVCWQVPVRHTQEWIVNAF